MKEQTHEVKALIEAAQEVCEWLAGMPFDLTQSSYYHKLKSATEAAKKESNE